MELTDYQIAAMKTRLPTATLEYALYNLSSECGELLGHVAKWIRDDHPDDEDYPRYIGNIKKELGDVLWHVAAIAEDFELTLNEIAQMNLDKLASRKQRGTITGSGDDR